MTRDFWVGAGIAGFALFLLLVLIPYAVVTPKSIRNIVLSPVFWPNILSGLMLLGGLGLAYLGWKREQGVAEPVNEPGRVVALLILMPVYVGLIPYLGMVWASMLAFAAFLLLVRNRRHLSGLLTAILLPLVLFAFFFHIAGVAIPQGKFIILP